MKRQLLIIFIYLISSGNQNSIAQAPPFPEWQKCYGGTGVDIPEKIIHSNDGGYIFTGSTTSANNDVTFNHGSRDIWVVKTNSAGTIQWQKTFGGSSSDFATSLLQLSNNDIVIAGYTASINGNVTGSHGSIDAWLIRINSSGNLIWQKTFGGSSIDICYSMILASDGGFILAGSSSSNDGDVSGNHGGKDFWILKTDSNGNLQWQKSIGGSGTDECYEINATSDGGYLAAGYTNSNDGQVSGNHGGNDDWIVKIDSVGNLQWQKCLGGTSNEVVTTAIENSSGNLMIGGYTNSNDGDVLDNHGSSDYWLVWLDSSNGNILSQRSYGGSNSDVAYSLIATADGGYILAGGSSSHDYDVDANYGGEDFWITKTDVDGNIVWTKNYGGSANDRPASIIQNSDGGFSVIGYTYSNNTDVSGNHGNADIWFLKLSCLTPVSDFSITQDTVCINSIVSFTNASIHSTQYEWQIDDILFSYNTYPNFQFYSAGTHKISLISKTCYAKDTLNKFITVVNYPVPSIVSSNPYLCAGNTATLSTIAADSFLWNTGETTPSIVINSGGSYSVTVTKNGCSASTSFSINQYSYPSVNLGNDTAICADANITLHAQSGYQSYIWQNGSTDSLFTAGSAGIYFVTVSNGHCHTVDSITITTINNPVPSISSSNSYICDGSSATLSTNIADYYLWNTGETSSSISIDSGGVYSVSVTTNGCSGSAFYNINQYSNPIINLGNDTSICENASIHLYAQSSYQSYLWQDGSTNSNLTSDTAGIYSVTVSNGHCSTTDSITISTISNPVPFITSSSNYLCDGNSAVLSTISADQYLWTTGETSSSITVDSGGVYSVTVTTSGCSGSSTFAITQYSNPIINLGNDTSICETASIRLHAQPGYQSYLWQDSSTNSDLIANSGGIYFVSVSNGYCITTDSITISIINNPVPTITSSNNLCDGDSVTLSTIAADNYLWSTGDTTSTITISAGGNYSITVTTNGCSGSSSLSIPQYSYPSVELGNDTIICANTQITLHASAGYLSYLWQDGSTDSVYIANNSGLYFVNVSNGHCISADSIFIITYNCSVLTANFSASQTSICQHACINYSDLSQSATSWDWYFEGATTPFSNQQNPTNICYDTAGTYSVFLIVRDTNGDSTGMVRMNYITVNSPPAPPVITDTGTILTCSQAYSYQWLYSATAINGATAQVYNATQTGFYSVMITDSNGCSSISDSIYIDAMGTGNQNEFGGLKVFPNPSEGIFNIAYNKNSIAKIDVDVKELTGKTLLHSTIESSGKSTTETINLEQFSNGIYLLQLRTDSKNFYYKLVIDK